MSTTTDSNDGGDDDNDDDANNGRDGGFSGGRVDAVNIELDDDNVLLFNCRHSYNRHHHYRLSRDDVAGFRSSGGTRARKRLRRLCSRRKNRLSAHDSPIL
mmetsp:Transcript_24850/g.50410  ORF Transcript_24850/g.50410 Transcript_24850/m.50410 type:complete len:101 (-) Transcript_24850:83-385(-)